MATPVMTLDQFRRSRVYCADLAKHEVVGTFGCDEEGPAYVYEGGCYINIVCAQEGTFSPPELRGAFHLILNRSEWLSDDILTMERHLYDYAIGEGIIAAPVRDPGRFHLSEGVLEDALNAACRVVQDAIGQTDGGVAGVFFSGDGREGFDEVMLRYGRCELLYSPDADLAPTVELLEAWAKFALPTSEADWGSERQIAAQNFFFEKVAEYGVDTARWETAKATVEEMVEEALQACRDRSKAL